ncbi:hypothetical protein E2C01_055330 [Portunus trituberculatus]|uniref:Uncharacterized protein n=1 Tax=Portunus trituberculatus TaxID=210409 RepID=A0A5B7GQW3_PORTR|nr:hypothetical protein [Portunus trituberculatus]
MVRYEDLSFNVYNMTKKLFDFFHLSYHPRVQAFLDTHTKQTIGGVSSTFRDSKVAPIHWQQDLSWKDVKQIQSTIFRKEVNRGAECAGIYLCGACIGTVSANKYASFCLREDGREDLVINWMLMLGVFV